LGLSSGFPVGGVAFFAILGQRFYQPFYLKFYFRLGIIIASCLGSLSMVVIGFIGIKQTKPCQS
jgi:hypothetical protein